MIKFLFVIKMLKCNP